MENVLFIRQVQLDLNQSDGSTVMYGKQRKNLVHLLSTEKLAAAAGTSYGCYFVPAFSGLYAPYWEPSARG